MVLDSYQREMLRTLKQMSCGQPDRVSPKQIAFRHVTTPRRTRYLNNKW